MSTNALRTGSSEKTKCIAMTRKAADSSARLVSVLEPPSTFGTCARAVRYRLDRPDPLRFELGDLRSWTLDPHATRPRSLVSCSDRFRELSRHDSCTPGGRARPHPARFALERSSLIVTEPIASHLMPELEQLEARRQLLARAQCGVFAPIAAHWIVDHLLVTVQRNAGWPVLRDALEATIERMALARREGWRVHERPSDRFGVYSIRDPRAGVLADRALLRGVQPIAGSCGCADFLRNSLGLCGHLLIVLADLAEARRTWEAAALRGPIPAIPRAGGFTWDPVCPLYGSVDWLRRVAWQGPGDPPAPGRKALDTHGRYRPEWLADDARRLTVLTGIRRTLRLRSGTSPPCDPALVTLVEDEHRRLREDASFDRDRESIEAQLDRLSIELYPFQRASVFRFLAKGRLLLGDDMGLGKTAQAIACATVLVQLGRIDRVLVVCPAPLKSQWVAEWRRFSRVAIAVVEGPPRARRVIYRRFARGSLVVNYEQLRRDVDLVRDWAPEMVILDEAQRIKNRATQTARAVKRLEPRFRLALTGTPLENRLDELVSIVEWIDAFALEPSWRVSAWHTVPGIGTQSARGIRELGTLRERLDPIFLRRTRKEVIGELPPRRDTELSIVMVPDQSRPHQALRKEIAKLLSVAKKRPLTLVEFNELMGLLTAQRVIANGMAQVEYLRIWKDLQTQKPTPQVLESLSSPKLSEFRELTAELLAQPARKIVVFGQWRRALLLAHWAIHDLLEARGERAVFFTGKESLKRRTHNVVDFHDDPHTRLFLSTDAGGTGLNLQRAADCVIHFELPWNPAVLEQRVARVHRLGQTKPIDVYRLVSRGSIESRLAALLDDKKALFDELFDGDQDTVSFRSSGSFLGRLVEIYPPRDSEPPPPPSPRPTRPPRLVVPNPDVEVDRPPTLHPAEVQRRPPANPRARDGALEHLGLQVQVSEDGNITLSADPTRAAEVSMLLDGLARLLERTREHMGRESSQRRSEDG